MAAMTALTSTANCACCGWAPTLAQRRHQHSMTVEQRARPWPRHGREKYTWKSQNNDGITTRRRRHHAWRCAMPASRPLRQLIAGASGSRWATRLCRRRSTTAGACKALMPWKARASRRLYRAEVQACADFIANRLESVPACSPCQGVERAYLKSFDCCSGARIPGSAAVIRGAAGCLGRPCYLLIPMRTHPTLAMAKAVGHAGAPSWPTGRRDQPADHDL